MRVVLDTNVFVSALVIPGSQGERALALARQGRFELCTSVAILTETAGRLRAKFEQDDEDIKEALRQISRTGRVVRPSRSVAAVHDEADNRILECALEAHADLVVTGDRHLLKLKRFEGIPIVRLADFLRLFPWEGQEESRSRALAKRPSGRSAIRRGPPVLQSSAGPAPRILRPGFPYLRVASCAPRSGRVWPEDGPLPGPEGTWRDHGRRGPSSQRRLKERPPAPASGALRSTTTRASSGRTTRPSAWSPRPPTATLQRSATPTIPTSTPR